jgi:hypothetical protein
MKCSFLRRGAAAAAIAAGAGLIAMAGTGPAGAAAAPAARPAAHPAAPSWASAIVLVTCRHHGVVTPRSYVLACADGNDFLSGLRWAYWQGTGYGWGWEHLNSCKPNCSAGHFHRYRVLVTVWRPKWRGKHIHQLKFTRLTAIYTHRRPLRFTSSGKTHHPQTFTWHL